jgi:hypothetical protein
MKVAEFKAWLEGYLEAMEGVSEQTGKVLERIQEQAAKLEDTSYPLIWTSNPTTPREVND